VQKNFFNGLDALHLVERVFELRRWTVKVFQLRNALRLEFFKELGYLDFRFPSIQWRNTYPNLDKLHEKLMQRQSFIDSLPK
jgi:hypothetical protein